MAAAFDTLSAAKELQAAGFEQTQAEAVAKIVRAGQGDLATQDDIAGVRTKVAAVRTEVAAVRTEVAAVRTEVAAVRTEVDAVRTEVAAVRTEQGAMKWVLGLMAALNVAILVRLLLD